MNTLILDAALGTQLAVNGEELPDWKKSLWSAHALIYKPEAILKIHLDNIEAIGKAKKPPDERTLTNQSDFPN